MREEGVHVIFHIPFIANDSQQICVIGNIDGLGMLTKLSYYKMQMN